MTEAVDLRRSLVDLGDRRAIDPARSGHKAATLAVLAQAGFPVPAGVILTADATAGALQRGAVPSPMPTHLRQLLATMPERLGEDPLAVRSSGVAEDLADASFAGLYETVLGVGGVDDLEMAVLRCWESALSPRVQAYRSNRGGDDDAGMAVLIQRQVDADVAGVAFTTDPVTGSPEVVINAVAGPADRMAAGEVTPEEWRIAAEGGIRRTTSGGPVLTEEQVRRVAELARGVAEHQETPQDIEWAIEGEELWLLQARPITTLGSTGIEPVPVPVEVPPGSWMRDAGHFPNPHSPLGRSITYPVATREFARAMVDIGLLSDGLQLTDIGGWHYVRIIPPGNKEGAMPPGWVLGVMTRVVPSLRARARAARRYLSEDRPRKVVEDWFEHHRPRLIARIEELTAVKRSRLGDADALDHFDSTIELAEDAVATHTDISFGPTIELYRLMRVCRDVLGWDEVKLIALLAGLSEQTSAPAVELAGVASIAAADPTVVELLRDPDEQTIEELAAASPEFTSAFERYRWTHGIRALSRDLGDPTLAESPRLLLRLIADQIESGFDPDTASTVNAETRSRLLAEAEAILANRTEHDRTRFADALARARRAYPLREDNVYYAIQVPLGLIHHAAFELGRRLADRGQIETATDVFLLEKDELRSAFLSGEDRRGRITRRRGERRWVLSNPGPGWYGSQEEGEPPIDWLPRALRLVHAAVFWADRLDPMSPVTPDPSGIRGTPASSGRYTGPVRIITDESEFDKMRVGDVVVCPVTQPTWSVLFPTIGAVVTDTGGLLSHPAIIAREYRVPAVVGTGNATAVLHDGQVITVDGDTGTVEIVG